MQRRPAATRDGSATGAATVSLETNFLLSVFAELTGRPRLSDRGAAEPMGNPAGASDRTPAAR
jgi:hypothetical protein